MPVLNLYEGISEILVFYFPKNDSIEGFKLFRFPYKYADDLYGSGYSKEKFYQDIIQVAMSEFQIDASQDIQYHFTSFFAEPSSNLTPSEGKKFISSHIVLDNISPNVLAVYQHAMVVEGNLIAFHSLKNSNEDLDYVANMGLYGNYAIMGSNDLAKKFTTVRNMLTNSEFKHNKEEYLFSGDVFIDSGGPIEQYYLLILDILYSQGIFSVSLDQSNLVSGSAFLKGQDPTHTTVASNKLCTLANFPGKVEVLIENDVGGKQLLNLEAGKIFAIPQNESDESRVVIKFQGEVVEKRVKGGSLGLVFDTRDKQNNRGEYKEVYLNMLREYLKSF